MFSISKKIEHALDTHRPGTLCASCGALQLNLSCNRIGEKDNVALAWFTNYKWLEDSSNTLILGLKLLENFKLDVEN